MLAAEARPLEGLRVLDLTRILAGPVAGRTLAAFGADVMLVNSPKLPNISAIADTSRGKRSALADLHEPADRAALVAALQGAHVMLQAYRPGGLAALGFGAEQAAALRPGIVHVSLSAYGRTGPWAQRRGFDSLVQTATGINDAEGTAFGAGRPRALPMQILDMASAFLLAFGAEAALLRQRQRRRQLAGAGVAGANRPLAALARPDRARLRRADARLRRAHRDRRLGLRPAGGDPAGHRLLGDPATLCATLGPTGHAIASPGTEARRPMTESRPPSGSLRTLPNRP